VAAAARGCARLWGHSMFLSRFCPPGLFHNARVAALCCVAGMVLSLSALFAHEGHDDDATRSALTSSTYPRISANSELYELVGIVRGERLSIYLDHLATNESVSDAKVRVTVGDAEPVDAEPTENGIYTIPFARGRTGSVEVVFSVTAASGDDLLVGALTLPSDTEPTDAGASSIGAVSSIWISSIPWPIRHPIVLILITFGLGVVFGHLHRSGRFAPAMATGAVAAGVLVILAVVALSGNDHDHSSGVARSTMGAGMSDAPRRLPDGTAFVAKPTQRLLEVRTAVALPETVRPAVNLIGRVIGDPNRTSVVQSIHGGRVIPLEGGIPRIGQAVSKGDVLAQVEPYLPLADRTTISEKTARSSN
jgi:hypothetical protein